MHTARRSLGLSRLAFKLQPQHGMNSVAKGTVLTGRPFTSYTSCIASISQPRCPFTDRHKHRLQRSPFSTITQLRDDPWLSILEPVETGTAPATTRPTAFPASQQNHGAFTAKSITPKSVTRQPLLAADNAKARLQLKQVLGLKPHDDVRLEKALLVAMDLEYHEHSTYYGKITKLGVVVCDPLALTKSHFQILDSGHNSMSSSKASSLYQSLPAAFFRPLEVIKSVREFTNTFRYGPNTFIRTSDIRELLSRILRNPLRLHDAAVFDKEIPNINRNIVLVLHGAQSDIDILRRLDVHPSLMGSIVTQFDTSIISSNNRRIKLIELLQRLNLPYIGLHNAGNDAMATMIALLRLGVWDQKHPERLAKAMQAEIAPSDRRPWLNNKQIWSFGGTASIEKLPKDMNSEVVDFIRRHTRSASSAGITNAEDQDARTKHSTRITIFQL